MRSWLESANTPDTDFPLNNLPYGVFSLDGDEPRCGVAIGDMILDVAAMEAAGLLRLADDPVFDVPFWNEVMELGPQAWERLRVLLFGFLGEGAETRGQVERFLVPQVEADMHLPFLVAEFTGFCAGLQHVRNMGEILHGSPDLPASLLHMPQGYGARASSVVVSGTDLHRPLGQTKAPGSDPSFGPSQWLDIGPELGAVVGTGSALGQPLTVGEAEAMIFGYVLLNGWCARDFQEWEGKPAGVFQARAFGTSISPWIVTAAALEPFRTAAQPRETPLLPYLAQANPGLHSIGLEVQIRPEGAARPTTVARTNTRELSFSAAQMLAQHAISGCAMNPGDLLGSGTISGAGRSECGSLTELSRGGAEPLILDSGESRSLVEDGDTVILRGAAEGAGFRVGFGGCHGKTLPPNWPKGLQPVTG